MKKFSKIFAICLCASTLGFIFSLGYEPFSQWWAPLLALALMISLTRERTLKVRLGLWYLFGLGYLGPLLHWTSIYVGSMPWIILIIGQSFFFALIAFGFTQGKHEPYLFASLFLIAEFLRATIPFGGFGWGRLGFSQLDGPLEGWLRIGGVAIVGWVGAFLAFSIVKRDRSSLFVAVGVLLLPFGASFVATAKPINEESTYRVGLIQGGVSQLGLDFNATPEEVFNRHFSETESLIKQKNVDLILWPENASDIDPLTNQSISKRIDSVLQTSDASLVIGAVTQSPKGPENVSLHYEAGRGLVSRYQKRDLVPFGEYVPLRDIAGKFSPLVETVKDFVPGKEVTVHQVGSLVFSPLICFEVLDDEVVREAISVSTVGVIQTNNATFGRSPQSAQQFQISRVRAYEYRIPVLVAATTGKTAMISSDGEVLESLADFESGHLVVDVSPSQPNPPPIRTNHLLAASSLLIIGSLLWKAGRRRLENIRDRFLGRITA